MTERPQPDDDAVARLRACLDTLSEIVEDRLLLDRLPAEERRALLIAAGRLSGPERSELRRVAKARRRRAKKAQRDADEEILDSATIRKMRAAPVFTAPVLPPPDERPEGAAGDADRTLQEPRKCYICKGAFTVVHHFYDQMCEPCAELNLERRHRTADLRGRTAIVTGSRVKIGYQAALKLLRAGAQVLVTTRFPNDAATRYAAEEDFEEWRDRLHVFGLDLRHTPSVEAFCAAVLGRFDRLDYIINNACQTVRRPAGFYQHLMDAERGGEVPEPARRLLRAHEDAALSRLTDARAELVREAVPGVADSAALSQLALLPEDRGRDLHLFPAGQLDQDLQQIDRRGINSWRLRLDEVSAVELLEVQLVNAVAPFVINARLRELMKRVPTEDKHIVNVSAMEGQFYRRYKTDRHPHTNMAKAALNMMTRTSAADYIQDGIHMNSVDTGWVTDEDPAAIAARKTEVHGFHPPLDIVDGAARIVDPIFDGIERGEHVFGLFLKDYRPVPW